MKGILITLSALNRLKLHFKTGNYPFVNFKQTKSFLLFTKFFLELRILMLSPKGAHATTIATTSL